MRKLLLFVAASLFYLTLSAQTTLDTAVNFNAKDPYGVTYTLFDILDAGNYVVIDFFSTG